MALTLARAWKSLTKYWPHPEIALEHVACPLIHRMGSQGVRAGLCLQEHPPHQVPRAGPSPPLHPKDHQRQQEWVEWMRDKTNKTEHQIKCRASYPGARATSATHQQLLSPELPHLENSASQTKNCFVRFTMVSNHSHYHVKWTSKQIWKLGAY